MEMLSVVLMNRNCLCLTSNVNMKISVESIKVSGPFHDLLITFTLQEERTEQWESAEKLTGYTEQQFFTCYPLDSDLL